MSQPYRDPAVQEWCWRVLRDGFMRRYSKAEPRMRVNVEAQSRIVLASVSEVIARIVESIEFREAVDRNTDVLNLQPIIGRKLLRAWKTARDAIPADRKRTESKTDSLNEDEINALLVSISNVLASLMVAAGIEPTNTAPTYGFLEDWKHESNVGADSEAFSGNDELEPAGILPPIYDPKDWF